MEAFLERQVILGHNRGQIPKSVKADETAKPLLSLVVGIRVLARGVFDAAGLHAIETIALGLISV